MVCGNADHVVPSAVDLEHELALISAPTSATVVRNRVTGALFRMLGKDRVRQAEEHSAPGHLRQSIARPSRGSSNQHRPVPLAEVRCKHCGITGITPHS